MLCVANVDPKHSELFTSFLYHWMKTLGLINVNGTSFAVEDFIYKITFEKNREGVIFFMTSKYATSALKLHNIHFMGKKVQLERHKSWVGPGLHKVARYNWDDVLAKALTGRNSGHNDQRNEDQGNFGIVVKNIPHGHAMVVPDYITSAMKQLAMIKEHDEPVREFQVLQGGMGLLDFHTDTDARNALSLQNIPLLGQYLQFERKSISFQFESLDQSQNWSKSINDIYLVIQEEEANQIKREQREAAANRNQVANVKEIQEELGKTRHDLAESREDNERLNNSLEERLRDIASLTTTIKSKDVELNSISKDLLETRKTVDDLLETNKKLSLQLLSKPTELAKKPPDENNAELIFLRREVEMKRGELEQKAKRIQELEKSNERHLDRILSLTDDVLADGTKQRKLEQDLENERNRRKALERNAQQERTNRNAEVRIIKEEDNNEVGVHV